MMDLYAGKKKDALYAVHSKYFFLLTWSNKKQMSPYPAVWFITVFLLTTISVVYAILTLVKLEKPAAIASEVVSEFAPESPVAVFAQDVEQNTNFVKAGLSLNVIGWAVALIAILVHRSGKMTAASMYKSYVGWEVAFITLSFASIAVGSILLTIAATNIMSVNARLTYIFAISAGVFGLAAAFFQLLNWFGRGANWIYLMQGKGKASRAKY